MFLMSGGEGTRDQNGRGWLWRGIGARRSCGVLKGTGGRACLQKTRKGKVVEMVARDTRLKRSIKKEDGNGGNST